jgi:hypothetical protein
VNRYCRICWNSHHWHEPTGEAAKLEVGKAFVRENGFGLEEWLFNFAWLQPGPKGTSGLFRYGFLQPIGKFRSKYERQTFDVFLYTITPNKKRLAVGIIKELYVPTLDELEIAHQYMGKRGWLDQMVSDLSSLGLKPKRLSDLPDYIANVRFRQSNVEFFDPRFILPKNHVISRIARYHPLNWTGTIPRATGLSAASGRTRSDGKKKAERERTKAAIESTTYSPRHDILQNALDTFLRDRYGHNSVRYESDFVDLQLHRGRDVAYFEIKIALTAKNCIREALGQLLEYAVYPGKQRASEMIVVGEHPATPDDGIYLNYLRKKFGIPVRYIQWNWEQNALAELP